MAYPAEVDPIRELAHDHRDLNELLLAVHEALARVDRGQSNLADELHEIRDGVEVFREALLEHFAREQEALLPFVVTHLPAVRDRTDKIVVEHDRIADALTTLVKGLDALEAGAPLGTWRTTLGAFEELYARHTKSEIAFLEEVAASLSADRATTEQLRLLLET